MGPRHSPVALLALLSWGSNQADKTGVSFFSFAAGISSQTRQTGRSLQMEEQKGESEQQEEEHQPVNDSMEAAAAYNRARRSLLSRRSWRALLTLKQGESR